MTPALCVCEVYPDGRTSLKIKNWSHVGIVVDDLASVYKELKNKVKFVTEPKWRIRPDGSTVGLVYGQDPEGNWLEFTQRP